MPFQHQFDELMAERAGPPRDQNGFIVEHGLIACNHYYCRIIS